MNILIVEDDFTFRRILTIYLKAIGECDVAVDGDEAVAAVKAALGEGRPYDLVVLDIMMPGLNGLQVLKTIRELERSYSIPAKEGAKVIMSTVETSVDTIIESFNERCEGYLMKPFDRDKLMETLEKVGIETP